MRRPSRGAAVPAALAALSVLVAGWLVAVTLGAPAGAHTPHDDQGDVAISPDFATDRRVWTVSQGMVLRSDDAGTTWIQLQAGVPPTVSNIEVAPGDPSVLYLLAVFGGVYRSTDGGDTWERTAAVPALALQAVAVSPIDPSTLLIASARDGNHLSTDAGDTWQPVPPELAGPTVGFGAEAALLIGGDDGRVHRSDDNGLTWTTATAAPGVAITALAAGGDEVVYAGTADGRVLRSDDDGRTFAAPPPGGAAGDGDGGLPAEPVRSLARSPHHATDGTVWAVSEATGPHRSTDRGSTWEPAAAGTTTDVQADVFGQPDFRDIVAGEGDGDGEGGDGVTLFLAGFDGLFRSTDGGDSWLASETLGERIVAIAVSPNFAADRTVAVATYLKGAFLSTDAGETWRAMSDGLEFPLSAGNELVPLRRMHGMNFSPGYRTDRTIYSATWVGFLRHQSGRWTEALIGQGGSDDDALLQQFVTAVHPDGTIYMGTAFGELYRSTARGNAGSWEVVGQFGGEARSLLVDPTSGDLWVATSTDVFTSTDGGATFRPTGLDRPSMAAGWFGPAGPVVFAGTAEGLFVTRDGGSTWEPVGVLGDDVPGEGFRPPAQEVEAIGVSPDYDEDGLVLVSLGRFGLFRSTDGGASFRPIAGDLLADQQLIGEFLANASAAPIQFSPRFADDGTVFAHTDRSVLRSTDRGETWDVLTLPSVFQVLADEAPEQLHLVVTPDPVPGPTPVEDHGTEAAIAWAVIGVAAVAVAWAVVAGLSPPRRRG